MLKFDNIINNINNLHLALENNNDLVKPSLSVISSFNEIKQDLLKIKYTVNKKKVLSFIENHQKKTEQSFNLIISQDLYENYYIDKFFDFILKILNIFNPNIFSIISSTAGVLELNINNFDPNKLNAIHDTLLDMELCIKDSSKLIVSNIGSLEKFIIVESKLGRVAIPYYFIDYDAYKEHNLKLNIYDKTINLEYKILEEIFAYRKIIEGIYKTKIFNGVLLDKQHSIVPVLSLAYLYGIDQ